jgi:plasmid stabilization system protein ParE
VAELIYTDEAMSDLLTQADWYDGQRPNLGRHFLESVAAAADGLRTFPRQGRVFLGEHRLKLVRRFPFGVFHVLDGERVVVTAVLHLARDPQTLRYLLAQRPTDA